MGRPVERWNVTYEEGEAQEVRVPHSWGQDVSLLWEGPAVYRTEIEVPDEPSYLRFHGVSYASEVRIEGTVAASHQGMWDAFDADLTPWRGRPVTVEVVVTKNGGETYPVRSVLSGFLPYVFGTFGGIIRPVEIVPAGTSPFVSPATPRVTLDGRRLLVDGKPFFPRGVLDWGWNPTEGIPTFPAAEIERQLHILRARGFNLVKFCLWLPSHEHLQLVRQAGMMAWIELPLWAPSVELYEDPMVEEELERIVRQYRGHDHVLAWTIGCELGEAPAAWRERMVAKVQALTGCPLVKDNSGGAEMYGGDPREFGTFADFHPYGDATRFPALLDALTQGEEGPVLLGETFDADVHRDLPELHRRLPYWASGLAELNAKGVRWLHELPRLARDVPFKDRSDELIAASVARANFVRREAASAARMRDGVSGYVVTGLRDTPISTSGLMDDFGRSRFDPLDVLSWNGTDALLISPSRRTPWEGGGNVPKRIDPYCIGTHAASWHFVVHSEAGVTGRLLWRVLRNGKTVVEGFGDSVTIAAGERGRVGTAYWAAGEAGRYVLEAEFAGIFAAWTVVRLEEPPQEAILSIVRLGAGEALDTVRNGAPAIVFVTGEEGVESEPFWRESCPLFEGTMLHPLVQLPEVQFGATTTRALIPEFWRERLGDSENLMARVDLRNYETHSYALLFRKVVLTTLPLLPRDADPYTPVSAGPTAFTRWLWDLARTV